MKERVALVGTFNTKGPEYQYIEDCLSRNNLETVRIDVSCLEYDSPREYDFTARDVAAAAGRELGDIAALPLYKAAPEISRGAAKILADLVLEKKISGCLGLGGANGTVISAASMEALPLGFPKVIISVMAAVNVRWLVGHTDIVLFNAIGDAVLNPVLEVIADRAVAALKGMTIPGPPPKLPKMVALTVLGVTDPCISRCRELLQANGIPSLLFHSNGPGGATFERMVAQDHFWGVIDATTNELGNNLFGGVFDAGARRLDAALDKKLPLVVSSGACDFVNFWRASVPEKYTDRLFIHHSLQNALMRTNEQENEALGRFMADKLNRAEAPVRVLIPGRGFSKYDYEGGPSGADLQGEPRKAWFSPAANDSFVESLQGNLKNRLVKVEVRDLHINDPAFAAELVEALHVLRR